MTQGLVWVQYCRLVFCTFAKNPVQENAKLSSCIFLKTQFFSQNPVPKVEKLRFPENLKSEYSDCFWQSFIQNFEVLQMKYLSVKKICKHQAQSEILENQVLRMLKPI